MSIELTPVGVACNLRCPYCYENPMRDAGNSSPGYDLDAMKRGLEKEGGAFTLFGGEPLMMKFADLEEILRWGFDKYGHTSIQTNGSLITNEHYKLFHKYKTSIGISVDGPDELNDSRWAGTEEKTRTATAESHNAIRRLCFEAIAPSIIITLYCGNASAERLPKLLKWIQYLDTLGVRAMRVHLLEIDHEDVRTGMALTEDENVNACLALMELQNSLKRLKFDLFADMAKLLIGDGKNLSCIWGACDPLTTPAVQAVNGLGGRSNCNRTNKDGIDWVKAPTHGSERYIVLHETPFEDGGCKDCRFFFACKGQCPGTSIGGDWRNRSEQCQIYYRIFERIEEQLVYLGKLPISAVDSLRIAAENALLGKWVSGQGTKSNDHQDHWDAPHGYEHDDAGFTVHGDNGMTTTHTDIPHGDSNIVGVQ